ncbi:MAG: hypothetical protein V4662_18485 [Verrucomicrobiota bacterium]
MMGSAGNSTQGGNLLSRGIPAAPQASASQENNSGLSLPSSSGASVSRSRPLNKPKRASNVFMIGLALLFLGGGLVAAGWLFRDPILQAVETVKAMIPGAAASAEVADVASPSPSGEKPSSRSAKSPASEPTLGTTPDLADTAPAKPPGGFDPDEAPPQGLSAVVPPPATATASLENPTILKAQPAMSTTTPPTLDVPKGGLADVKSALPDAKVKNGTSPLDAPAPPSGEMAAGSGVRLDDITKEAMPAAEALQKFLLAADLQERLEFTLGADVMRPIMERYYSSNPDGPITVDSIGLVRFDPKPQMGGGAHAVFGLESKTWEFPVPVMLEMNQGKFKVDWLSFVEFKDRLLEKFLAGYQEGPARFHVGITRTHYFEDKVPNVSGKDVFRVSPAPPNPYASVIFLDKDSDLGRELRDKIPWGSQVWAIVELEWMKLGSQNWVQLSAVPQLNWYSVPAAPKALRSGAGAPVADDAQVPTETQKAVPVGR